MNFQYIDEDLPSTFQRRAIESTWHSSMSKEWADEVGWDQSSRYNRKRST
ncbi:hypothetical protein APX70_02842, partial [Pseudomonas syringae pv. maculicola]